MKTNITIKCGNEQYTLTHDQIKRMLYTVEYLAVSDQPEHYKRAQEKARACLAEQGRAIVTIPVGAMVEALT